MGIRAIGGRGILRWHWGNTRRTAAAVVAAGLSVLVVGISAGATSSLVVWTTKQAFPGEGVGHIYDVSCPTSAACMAVATYAGGPDVVLTSTDGGQSWRENAIGNTTPTLTGISCPTTSACVAVGDTAIELSQDGGSTWSNVPAPAFVNLVAVSCPTASNCFAVGTGGVGTDNGIIATTDGGAQWFTEPLPAPALDTVSGVSCANSNDCVAVGMSSSGDEAAANTTDSGQTWTISTISSATPGQDLTSVSCYTASDCVAVGRAGSSTTILGTQDGGMTFTADNLPTGAGSLDAVSCSTLASTSVNCVAVGAATSGSIGTILYSSDASTWSVATVPRKTPPLTAVACVTSDCSAGGSASGFASTMTTSSGGTSWTTRSLPAGIDGVYSESCPVANECLVAVYDGGTSAPGVLVRTSTESHVYFPTRVGYLYGISCASSTNCEVVGSTNSDPSTGLVLITADGGSTWEQVTLPSQPNGASYTLMAIACTTTTRCIASGVPLGGGEAIIASTNDGGQLWSMQPSPMTIEALSCHGTTFCVGVGFGSATVTTNAGVTWSIPVSTGNAQSLGIHCVSKLTCIAVGSSVHGGAGTSVTIDGGTSWTAQTLSNVNQRLNSISCFDTTTCVAVGGFAPYGSATAVATFDGGTTWTSESLPAGTPDLYAFSCPPRSSCFAAGSVSSGITSNVTLLKAQLAP